MAYCALVRSHLEYCSAVFFNMSSTNRKRLDVVQRNAARTIYSVPRDTPAQPLIEELRLTDLETRRKEHLLDIIDQLLSGRCHPALKDLLQQQDSLGELPNIKELSHRTAIGGRRFSTVAPKLYNQHIRAIVTEQS